MIPFASATNTKVNAAAMARLGFGVVLEPRTWRYIHHGPVMLDNGAFGCWTAGKPWSSYEWLSMLVRLHEMGAAPFHSLIIPDVVGDARGTWVSLGKWYETCVGHAEHTLLAVQDGMRKEEVLATLRDFPDLGLFVGGTTEWKEATIPVWGEVKAETGCYLHVARVNSWRRAKMCRLAGADSFDGTSATRFSKNAEKIAGWCTRPLE
jgi:hypothetical protein